MLAKLQKKLVKVADSENFFVTLQRIFGDTDAFKAACALMKVLADEGCNDATTINHQHNVFKQREEGGNLRPVWQVNY